MAKTQTHMQTYCGYGYRMERGKEGCLWHVKTVNARMQTFITTCNQ